jgi:predicted transcriptional regulator
LSQDFELDDLPTIAADENLREALSRFLASGASALVVMQSDYRVGIVQFEQIRALSAQR